MIEEVWYGDVSNDVEDKLAEFNAEFNEFYDEIDRDLVSDEQADLAFDEMANKYGYNFRDAFGIQDTKFCTYVEIKKIAMKKRIRIIDRKSLEKAMSLYAKTRTNRVSLNNAMEEQLQMVRNNYTDRIAECDEECDALHADMIEYARENRETVFPLGVKHLELADGTIGYKQGRNSLALQEGHTWASALEALQNDKSGKPYIRIKFEIDKARLIADRDKPKVAQIIDRMGLQIINAEQFYVEAKC